MGGPGGQSPHGGGCPPRNLKRGELPSLTNPPTSGTQNPGELSANGGGQTPQPACKGVKWGVQGGKAPWQGAWGMCPQKTLKGEIASPCNPATEWDLRHWRTIGKRGWEKGGPGGEAPMAGGVGGVPPRNLKRGELPSLTNPPTSGTQNSGKLSANGGGQTPQPACKGGKMGSRGAKPPWQGFGGCAPTKP